MVRPVGQASGEAFRSATFEPLAKRDEAARGLTTVIGPSGTGKSTLIRCINPWLRRFDRCDIDTTFARLDEVRLSGFALARADSLSGGQRQRAGIARALMRQPRLILADEPTSSLDRKTSVEIMALIRDTTAEHAIPVLINMHDVELARRFADRIVGMSCGEIVFDGAPEVLTDTDLKRIYGSEEWLR